VSPKNVPAAERFFDNHYIKGAVPEYSGALECLADESLQGVKYPGASFCLARPRKEAQMSVLISKTAPDCTAPAAVMPDGTIDEAFKLSDLSGRYVVLFFWPLDFIFVCPTEIPAHNHRLERF
jgi:hypothetical protein